MHSDDDLDHDLPDDDNDQYGNIGSDSETEALGGNGDGTEDGQVEKRIVKPKRIIRCPRPKLNAATLKSKRGLTALESYFQRVKFKGRGHEETDLNVILKTYEYWCHRLFPKYDFEDCVAKIEHLGHKKEVQTHLRKIRMDILWNEDDPDNPVLDEAETRDVDEELKYDDDDVGTENVEIDRFDRLKSPKIDEITEEQLERMRQNRERAERIRQERLKAVQINEFLNGMENQNRTQAEDMEVLEGPKIDSERGVDENIRSQESFEVDSRGVQDSQINHVNEQENMEIPELHNENDYITSPSTSKEIMEDAVEDQTNRIEDRNESEPCANLQYNEGSQDIFASQPSNTPKE